MKMRKIISITGFMVAIISFLISLCFCVARISGAITLSEYYDIYFPLMNITIIGMIMTLVWKWRN